MRLLCMYYSVLAAAALMIRVTSMVPMQPLRNNASKTCEKGDLDSTLQLACAAGGVITGVAFAQYGLISGSCPSSLTTEGTCDVDISRPVESACVGQSSCSIMCSHSCCPSASCCGCLLTSGSNKTAVHYRIPDPLPGATKVSAVRVICNNSLSETTTPLAVVDNVVEGKNNVKNNVSYFSWYAYTGCGEGLLQEPNCLRNISTSPSRAYRNLAMDGDLGFLLRR